MIGAYAPFLALYFSSVGLSVAQIAILVSVPQLMRIVGPAFWGWLADRFGRRLLLLRLSAGAAVALTAALALAGGHYATVFVLLTLLVFATSAQAPLAEAMALSVAAGDSGRYGRMRLWGSIGFTGALAFSGPLLDLTGVQALPVLMCALAAMLLAVTWRVPEPPAKPAQDTEPVWRRLLDPPVAAFFVSTFLMMFAHAALYGFYSLRLDSFGYSKTAIGFAWTIGVLAEIVLFRVQRPLFEHFGALPLLGASLAVAALRFALIGWGGDSLLLVVAVQLMHAVTFGVHHSAAMALLHRWFDERQQGRAQALYTTVGFGLGGSSGGIAAGWLWVHVGPEAAFQGAAAVAALGWVAVAACRRFEYARERTGQHTVGGR